MRIGILHGYELTGSGSNEYTRYLAKSLAEAGHEVHMLCREPTPHTLPFVTRALAWTADGRSRELFRRDAPGTCVVHRLPHAPVRPVYLMDKQRLGNVKSFRELNGQELREHHATSVRAARGVFAEHPVDVVHANHVVWQPCIAMECGLPFVVFPHGSSLEYVVRHDRRYRDVAAQALDAARGVISGSREMVRRMHELFGDAMPLDRTEVVGVGVDTSLFAPVAREGRAASIARVAVGRAGKTSEQREDLRARLAAGDRDAVVAYREAYDHACPDADAAERLARLPWQGGKFVLFVGSLTAGKGLQSVIAALPRVLERHPETHLVVAGSGAYREVLEALVHAIAAGDRDLLAWLCAHGFDLDRSELRGPWTDIAPERVFRPGLSDHVHFVGRLDHGLLRHVFPCADLAVFPSVVPEAYPLALMEALSNGVLPVVSDFSGLADGLERLEPLLGADVVDRMRLPHDGDRVPLIAERLVALLGDAALAGLGPQLRAVAVEHYDWRVRAEQMVGAYERLLQAAPVPGPAPAD